MPGTRAAMVVAILVLAASPPSSAQAQRADTVRARVTYVSGSSVYIDAGERNGLSVGAGIDVLRNGVIARLTVRFLSPGRAQCDVVSANVPLVVGDTVTFTRSGAAIPPRDTTVPVPAATPLIPAAVRRASAPAPLRGRIGARYLASWQRDSGGAALTQPSTDLRVEGTVPGMPSISLAVDARARRTRTVAIDGVVAPTRATTLVYQSWLAWRAPVGTQLRVGRQYSDELSSVSLFDGVLLALDRSHVGVGAFGGTQPDVATMGYSSRVREFGAYATARSGTATSGTAALSAGAVSSYDGGQVDRDFAFGTASWYDRWVSFYATQEVDYNRGWKRAVGEPAMTPTSTYVSLRVRAMDALSVSAGYDSRRSVRLYRDYVSPATTFDDTYRTGMWGGVFVEPTSWSSASVDYRHSKGGSASLAGTAAGPANVVTVNGSARNLWRGDLSTRARSSYFRSPVVTGWLHTLSLSGNPTDILRLELGGGMRRDTPAAGTASAAISDRQTVHWLELDVDVAVGRSWYVLLSGSRERGGWDANDQIYSAISFRF